MVAQRRSRSAHAWATSRTRRRGRRRREAWAAIGRVYDAALCQLALGEAIATSHGDRGELERVLLAARDGAAAIGSTHLVEVCESLARRSRLVLPGMKDDDGSAFPDLTPREREVLALVADGRTNRQIATELFITDKTASVHVSNILSKLDVSNRGEAAALAYKAGFELAQTGGRFPSGTS